MEQEKIKKAEGAEVGNLKKETLTENKPELDL